MGEENSMIPSNLIGGTITLLPGTAFEVRSKIIAAENRIYRREKTRPRHRLEIQVLSSDGSENGVWFVPSAEELETVR